MPIFSRTIILFFPWLLAASALEADTKATVYPGALVQKAETGKPADLAGMKAGDVVLSWERLASPPANPEPSRGDIRTIWDWHYILYEEASRGPVRLSVRRGGETLAFEFAAEGWGLDVIPVLEDASLARYLDGRNLINDGKLEEGLACWDALLRAPGLDRASETWLLHRKGLALNRAKKWEEAGEVYGRALDLVSDPDLPMARFLLYASLASAQERLKEFDKARETYNRQRELSSRQWGDSLNLAWSLVNLGSLAFKRGDLDTAGTMFTRALDIRTKVSPGSLMWREA
jgi:tetratricopeptide (TPR) repeat protein